MIVTKTDRGFHQLVVNDYRDGIAKRLISESSIVGPYQDALQNPGSSCLWIGEHHHLDREQIAALIVILNRWLVTGCLSDGDLIIQGEVSDGE